MYAETLPLPTEKISPGKLQFKDKEVSSKRLSRQDEEFGSKETASKRLSREDHLLEAKRLMANVCPEKIIQKQRD